MLGYNHINICNTEYTGYMITTTLLKPYVQGSIEFFLYLYTKHKILKFYNDKKNNDLAQNENQLVVFLD